MAQALLDLRCVRWPQAPVDAAEHFYRGCAPRVRAALGVDGPGMEAAARGPRDAAAVVFPSAGDGHRGWRLAAIQALAIEAAPRRVNGIVGDNDAAVRAAADWLAGAEAMTGQLLEVAGKSEPEG